MLSVSLHNPTKCSVNHYVHNGTERAAITFSSADGGEIKLFTSPDMADALLAAWKSLPYCLTCKQHVEAVNKSDECDTCHDEWTRKHLASLKSLYEGEKRAGLTKTRDELNADLRAAGRGHLIGDMP